MAIKLRSHGMTEMASDSDPPEPRTANPALAVLVAACLSLVFGLCLLTMLDATRPMPSRPDAARDMTAAVSAYKMRHPL